MKKLNIFLLTTMLLLLLPACSSGMPADRKQKMLSIFPQLKIHRAVWRLIRKLYLNLQQNSLCYQRRNL